MASNSPTRPLKLESLCVFFHKVVLLAKKSHRDVVFRHFHRARIQRSFPPRAKPPWCRLLATECYTDGQTPARYRSALDFTTCADTQYHTYEVPTSQVARITHLIVEVRTIKILGAILRTKVKEPDRLSFLSSVRNEGWCNHYLSFLSVARSQLLVRYVDKLSPHSVLARCIDGPTELTGMGTIDPSASTSIPPSA